MSCCSSYYQRYRCQGFRSGWCNQNPVIVTGPRGPVGPGATGATGATGAAALSDAIYAGAGTQNVANSTVIPISKLGGTTGTTMTVSGNAITVQPGTYLITYGASGSPNTSTTFAIELEQDGAPVTDSKITSEVPNNDDPTTVSNTVLLTTDALATLDIKNVSGAQADLTSAGISVVKLA